MDVELRAELMALRALLLLTLGEVANTRPDPSGFLADARAELVRALSRVLVEPEEQQAAVRAGAAAFIEDWLGHIHFKEPDAPAPY